LSFTVTQPYEAELKVKDGALRIFQARVVARDWALWLCTYGSNLLVFILPADSMLQHETIEPANYPERPFIDITATLQPGIGVVLQLDSVSMNSEMAPVLAAELFGDLLTVETGRLEGGDISEHLHPSSMARLDDPILRQSGFNDVSAKARQLSGGRVEVLEELRLWTCRKMIGQALEDDLTLLQEEVIRTENPMLQELLVGFASYGKAWNSFVESIDIERVEQF
jgi:hypothetical protein